MRLKLWQWTVLALPIALMIGFLLVAAGWQINAWGLNWIWAVFTLVFVGWRWLLVQWTRPALKQVEAVVAEVQEELEATDVTLDGLGQTEPMRQAEQIIANLLQETANDSPIWEDWSTFWQRCQTLVIAIAHIYHPEVKYPLLNIYVPQAYALMRGTMNDVDQWMQKLSPALSQLTVGQAVEAYEIYQKLEPSARNLWRLWNWAQWLLNPITAIARQASQRYSDRATQQLLVNVSQLLREVALRNLARQAIALYSGNTLPDTFATTAPALPKVKTQTLREILEQAEPIAIVEQKNINILLAGRTGAGKSSLINTLFQADLAQVDVLPNTDQIQQYQWSTPTREVLTLWDTPGYEQIERQDFRSRVLEFAARSDLLLLATPALDPALQMDVDFLKLVQAGASDLPVIVVVTQVDRLRPVREWQPPYDWQFGDRPKEVSIRAATQYRVEQLGDDSDRVLPVVTRDFFTNARVEWNVEELSTTLVQSITPAKQLRLARFLRNLDARTIAAAKIIDHYTFQMSTTQGLAALLKSPVLQFISTLMTGSPALAQVLAERIPVEQLPVVIGKLQMAYELSQLLTQETDDLLRYATPKTFDLRSLWPVLLDTSASPDRNAWAFGHAFVEYWTQDQTIEQMQTRFEFYLNQK
jgi:hypothetical protein